MLLQIAIAVKKNITLIYNALRKNALQNLTRAAALVKSKVYATSE